MRKAQTTSVVIAIALLLAAASARGGASDEKPQSALAIQGGWWSVEAEWKTKIGVFAAVGVPWAAIPLTSHAIWLIPYGARIGYQRDISRLFKLRGAAHVAGTYSREDPCGDCARDRLARLRLHRGRRPIRGSLGFRSGGRCARLCARQKAAASVVSPPISFAFSQAYVGFSWRW